MNVKTLQESYLNLVLLNLNQGDFEPLLQLADVIGLNKENEIISCMLEKEEYKDLFEIQSCFRGPYEEDMILDGIQYSAFDFNEMEKKLSHTYLTKYNLENTFLINILNSNISEIGLNQISKEIAFNGQALSGAYKRICKQIEEQQESEIVLKEELTKSLIKLNKFFNWQVFEERSLLRDSEKTGLAPMITSLLIIRATIIQDECFCTGTCGKIMSSLSNDEVRCECGGEFALLSPYLNLEQVSFAFPSSIETIKENLLITPNSLFQIAEDILFPKKIGILLNRLSSASFGNRVMLPMTAQLHSNITNDKMQIIADYNIEEKDVISFCIYITDTRYSHSDLISAVSLPMIMREIKNRMKNKIPIENLIDGTKLEDWIQTPLLKVKMLSNYKELKSILKEGGGDNE